MMSASGPVKLESTNFEKPKISGCRLIKNFSADVGVVVAHMLYAITVSLKDIQLIGLPWMIWYTFVADDRVPAKFALNTFSAIES